jgi:uncharacterized membrane protein HdeD (DUF308 family)
MNTPFLSALGQSWWLVLLRGIAAIVFGIFAYTSPGVTLVTLTLFWGAYALVDGVSSIWFGWKAKDSGAPFWPVVLIGGLGIAAGIYAFIAPGFTAIALLMLIAGWAIVTGVLQIFAAIRLRKEIANEWLLVLSGVLSVLFGGMMIANPGSGALAVLWIIGAFAIVYGGLLIGMAFKLKKIAAM